MGWIEDYIDYNSSQESPPTFHKWVGLSVIAGALGNKVSLPRISGEGITFYKDCPGQLVICLVAGAGRCRKSTAVNIGKSLLKEVGVEVFDGKITPERLLHKLGTMPSGRPVVTIVASELSTFLSKASYNDGLIDILIKLFDMESNPYESQKGGVVKLLDPCTTGVWATTPYSLGKCIPAQAHETGFLSRILLVYSEEPGQAASLANNLSDINPQVRARSDQIRNSLIIRLRGFNAISGEFTWSPDGQAWFDKYYKDYRDSGGCDEEGYPQRRPDHLLRIGMCLAISNSSATRPTLHLDSQILTEADKWLSEIEANFPKAMAYIGQHSNAEKYNKIMSVFKEEGKKKGVKYAVVNGDELYHRVIRHFASPDELREHLKGLIDAGNIGVLGKDPKTNRWQYTVLKELY
jgi:hypothetical protein